MCVLLRCVLPDVLMENIQDLDASRMQISEQGGKSILNLGAKGFVWGAGGGLHRRLLPISNLTLLDGFPRQMINFKVSPISKQTNLTNHKKTPMSILRHSLQTPSMFFGGWPIYEEKAL